MSVLEGDGQSSGRPGGRVGTPEEERDGSSLKDEGDGGHGGDGRPEGEGSDLVRDRTLRQTGRGVSGGVGTLRRDAGVGVWTGVVTSCEKSSSE